MVTAPSRSDPVIDLLLVSRARTARPSRERVSGGSEFMGGVTKVRSQALADADPPLVHDLLLSDDMSAVR